MKIAAKDHNENIELLDVLEDYHYCTTLADGLVSNTNILLLEDNSVILETKIINNGKILDGWSARYSENTLKELLKILNEIKFE